MDPDKKMNLAEGQPSREVNPPPYSPPQQGPSSYPYYADKQGYQPGCPPGPENITPQFASQPVHQPNYVPPQVYTGQTAYVLQSPGMGTQVTVVGPINFLPYPMAMECPHCHSQITTVTRSQASTMAWILCVVLFCVGCSLGCCLIPFCVDACQDVIHSCPNCKAQLGLYHRRL